MGLAIGQSVPDTHDGVASLGTFLAALVEGFLNRGNVLIGHVASGGLVLKETREVGVFASVVLSDWLDVADDASVLSRTAGLLLV